VEFNNPLDKLRVTSETIFPANHGTSKQNPTATKLQHKNPNNSFK